MNRSRWRKYLLALVLLGGGVAAVMLLNHTQLQNGRDGTAIRADRVVPPKRRVPPSRDTVVDAGVPRRGSMPEPLETGDVSAISLGSIDFDALRKRTPNNMYWTMAVPTSDPEVLEARSKERADRNAQLGKVQSNTATEGEIRDYYAYQRKLSEDYIEVVDIILNEYGSDLTDRDTGLFELAVSMHHSKLGDIPKHEERALARRKEYVRAKEAWLARKASKIDGKNGE